MREVQAQSGLLEIWERGAGERTGRRALTLLACALPEAAAGELDGVSVGHRDALLLDLRERLFGSAFVGLTACPACGEEIELAFEAAELRRDVAETSTATVKMDGVTVEFRLPNAGDLAAIESIGDIPAARARLLARCILKATRDDDAAIPPGNLSPEAIAATTARMGELDPQADVALAVDCPSCAHGWNEPFDIVTFLWSELAVWARRLLEDVHQLATAYGWSERDILVLSPARRNAYLEMLR
jgi:hypothetical protein